MGIASSSEYSRHHPMVTFRCAGRLCALPATSVEESLRPLATAPIDGTAAFVLGMTTLRGDATPVVDLSRLLTGEAEARPRRWLSARSGVRRVALCVEDVVGVSTIDETDLVQLPGLLAGAAAEHVDAVTRLDGELVLVLRTGRVLPDGAGP